MESGQVQLHLPGPGQGARPSSLAARYADGPYRVPLTEYAKTHLGASQTVRELAAKYAKNPDVGTRTYDNSRDKGQAEESSLDALSKVKENYSLGSLYASLQAEHAAGRIDYAVFSGTAGRISETVYRATQARFEDT